MAARRLALRLPRPPFPAAKRVVSSCYHVLSHPLPPHAVAGAFRLPSSLPLPWRGICFSTFVMEAKREEEPSGMIDVPLAQTGEGIAECELLRWFVTEGDVVEEFQRLCEVQSDKATIEITSRFKGRVHRINYVPGDIIKVGETLLKLVVEDDIYGDAPLATDGACETHYQSSSDQEDISVGILATPAVRHLAKQYGITIDDVCGTGKDGRVLKEDIVKYAVSLGHKESSSAKIVGSPEIKFTKDESNLRTSSIGVWSFEDTKIPLRGFQRAMVKSMSLAAKVPHFHYIEEINCDALIELKAAFVNANKDQNVKHTFLPFLIKSLSMALNNFPLLNSSFLEESNEVLLKGCHNIGVAMDTSYGLVVPNIKKVQSLTIIELTQELSRLHDMASQNKLHTEDISGGTITLSNIGALGGKFGSPLLNLPEVAIIAIGRIQKVPRFDDNGTVVPSHIATVNVGADHRVVDGATVARFCNEWKRLIENPELLLLHMR